MMFFDSRLHYSPVVAHYGWEIIGREAFSVDLCCIGPLLMESTVCDHHIHVYWLEFKMAAVGHIYYVVTTETANYRIYRYLFS